MEPRSARHAIEQGLRIAIVSVRQQNHQGAFVWSLGEEIAECGTQVNFVALQWLEDKRAADNFLGFDHQDSNAATALDLALAGQDTDGARTDETVRADHATNRLR